MITPLAMDLPEDLRRLQKKWLEAKREEQDLIYSREFGPAFVGLFADKPLHGAKGERPKFKALISVLGMSWQPVALMAAWAKPECILILGTKESLNSRVGEEPVLDVLSRLSGIPTRLFEDHQIGEPEELGVYQEIRAFAKRHGYGPHEMVVDPTGGKKSMSASAGLAGFLTGAWIVYVDYAEYHAEKRIPVAGTEYPRLLHNPLEVFGELEFARIKESFHRGNFEIAAHIAEALEARLYETREAEALRLMSKGYGAWHQFNFQEAHPILERLKAHLEKFAGFGRWSWSTRVLEGLHGNCLAVKRLSDLAEKAAGGNKPESFEEGLPLVLNHLAAAERTLQYGHLDATVLLAYATLERYLDLVLWVDYHLDDQEPDYQRLPLDSAVFHRIGRKLHGKNYQERTLAGPVGLALAAQLLSTLNEDLLPVKYFGLIQGLMSARNRCGYEHGLCPRVLKVDEDKRHLNAVKTILGVVLSRYGTWLGNELDDYRFPPL